jgi:ferredoxin
MAYVITRLCTRYGDCVDICPVNCVVPGPKGNTRWPYFYIDPDACIDCGACVSVCPPEAIFPVDEVPQAYTEDIELNRRFFIEGPGYWHFNLEDEREGER